VLVYLFFSRLFFKLEQEKEKAGKTTRKYVA
jgi:hypothetical protein